MPLHRFDTASLAATPWKNGGGTTRQIVCRPEGAGGDGFDWRASIATIDRPGPFSAFAGVDRVIVLLDGAGVRLRTADGRIDHRLDRPHAPFAFAGEEALDAEPLGGASNDFNLMTRRGRLRAGLRVLSGGGDLASAGAGLLLALRGGWTLQARDAMVLAPGDGVWWDGGAQGWHAVPVDADAALIAVRLDAVPQANGPPTPCARRAAPGAKVRR